MSAPTTTFTSPPPDRRGVTDHPRRRPALVRRSQLAFLGFTVPAAAVYVSLVLWPALQAFRYSTTSWDGISPRFTEVGARNYERLAGRDTVFAEALGTSLEFMLAVVLGQTALSLGLALALQRTTRTNILLRATFFFPTVLSSVAVAFVWSFIYDPTFGLANRGLEAIGLGALQQSWLGDQQLAIYYLAVVQVWFHAGQLMVVYIAGLQAVPAELYEAAELDGAGRWGRFRHVTWPLIAPATTIVVAYTTIQSFKAFDLIIASTGGGPNHATEILSTLIYSTAFRNFEFGYAAAQSVIFVLLIAAVTVLQHRATRLTTGGAG